MKAFQKFTKKELLIFCVEALFAGVLIGFGGTASLLAASFIGGGWGRFIGGVLFALAMFMIISFRLKLFTGMLCDVPTMGVKNYWQLAVCLLFNTLGVLAVSLLVRYSFIGETAVDVGAKLIGAKLNAKNWAGGVLCSGVLCGVMINVSVWSPKFTAARGLSCTLGVILPIVLFAFCGFDHCVANMLYLAFLGECSWQIIGYVLLSVLGNLLGGVLLPLILLLRGEKKDA